MNGKHQSSHIGSRTCGICVAGLAAQPTKVNFSRRNGGRRAKIARPCGGRLAHRERCRKEGTRRHEGKDLVYLDKVGTGLNRTTPSKIREALDSVISQRSELSKPLRK
ncbi:hypothetical protein [Bradyrhizobium sp. USDA 3458]|uniref:hypothetical protein n=1 Tax=Bradyrhizobium sp. USDA 3458 TaxID=2591461 RepID=UPI001FED34A8|nr:hypothetical protein [Bradyrhizobium sp. USDA 3458]